MILREVDNRGERVGCTCVRSGEVDEARIGWLQASDVRSG